MGFLVRRAQAGGPMAYGDRHPQAVRPGATIGTSTMYTSTGSVDSTVKPWLR